MGGLGGAGNVSIGDTGISIGQATQAANFIQKLNSGDILGALTTASNLSGAGNTQIGDTGFTINDLAKNIPLAQTIMSGNPTAIVNALTGLAKQQAALNTQDANQVIGDYTRAGTSTVTGATGNDTVTGGDGVVVTPVTDTLANAGLTEVLPPVTTATVVDDGNGNLAGAQAAATARNTVAIGNAEADNPDEAAAAARFRNPNATQFTYGGRTYQLTASGSQLQAALTETNTEALKNNIANAPTRNDAYRIAREALGPNKTFTWGGKEYSTATVEERPDLTGTTSIDALNTRNLGTTTDASSTVAAQTDTTARTAGLAATTAAQQSALAATEKTGFFSNLANAIQNQMNLSSQAATEYLKNNPNSPITNSVSTAMEAAGNLQTNVAGGAALALGNKPLSDAFVKSGNDMTAFGQTIGNGPADTKNWNDTMSLLQNASGLEKLGVMAGRILDGTSGLSRQVQVELKQELPGLFLGGGTVKGIMLATGAMDSLETGGNQALETYDDEIKKGKTHAEALSSARIAGGVAAMTEAALQLTLGKLADFGAGKINSVAGRAGTKIGTESLIEGAQEGGAGAVVDATLGNAFDANKYLTQIVTGAAVGGGTTTATTPTDVVTSGAATTNLGTTEAVTPNAATTAQGTAGAVTQGAGATGGTNTGAATVTVADAQQVMSDLGLNVSDDTAVSLATQINNASGTTANDANSSVVAVLQDAGLSETRANTLADAITSTVTGGANTTSDVITQLKDAGLTNADANTVANEVTNIVATGASTSSGTATAATSTADVAATNTINNNITAAVTTGNAAGVDTAITNSVQTSLSSGASVNVAVGSSVTSAITNGADAGTSITSAVTSAVTSGADVNQTVTASVGSAITAGADSTVAIGSTVTSAISSGADSAVVVNSAVTSGITVGADVTSTITSAVQAAVTVGADVTTATNSATTAAVTASITAGADVTTTITNSVSAAVAAGANITTATNTATTAAVTALVTSGVNISTAITNSVTAAVAAGADVTTVATTATAAAVTASITAGTDATTAITAAVEAAVTAGADVTTASNAAIQAAIDAGVNSNVAIDAAVNSTANLNVNTNVDLPPVTLPTEVTTIIDKLPDPVIDKVTTLLKDPVIDKIIDKVIADPTIKVTPPKNPKVPSPQTGLTWPQATTMAASFGVPALANVFYYGKDFGSKKQKVSKTGELEQEEYRALSVTRAGAEGEQQEEAQALAQEKKTSENEIQDMLDKIMGRSDNTATPEEIQQIVRQGA